MQALKNLLRVIKALSKFSWTICCEVFGGLVLPVYRQMSSCTCFMRPAHLLGTSFHWIFFQRFMAILLVWAPPWHLRSLVNDATFANFQASRREFWANEGCWSWDVHLCVMSVNWQSLRKWARNSPKTNFHSKQIVWKTWVQFWSKSGPNLLVSSTNDGMWSFRPWMCAFLHLSLWVGTFFRCIVHKGKLMCQMGLSLFFAYDLWTIGQMNVREIALL